MVTARTALDGWPVELCDTAGLRTAEQPIEQEGIGLAERRLETASLVVLVFDAAEPWSEADAGLCRRFPGALVVFNKSDLSGAPPEGPSDGRLVSALEGEGIDKLGAAIAGRLVPHPPAPGQAVPFLEEQVAAIRAAAEAIAEGDLRRAAEGVGRMG